MEADNSVFVLVIGPGILALLAGAFVLWLRSRNNRPKE